uniref:Unique cartilage matrix-associated protein n=1 Tax=Scophthalmus maximus TaxID=52904 RepID=A0A8D3AA23_SCOMX
MTWQFCDALQLLCVECCVVTSEQRLVLAADERKREFHEEKRNEFESYAEEDHDEQSERTRESTEQWREFHYDGMHPPQEYNRHSV